MGFGFEEMRSKFREKIMRAVEIIENIEKIKNIQCISNLMSIVENTDYSVDISFYLEPVRTFFSQIKEIQIYLSITVLDTQGDIVMYWPENANYEDDYDESMGLIVNDLVGSYYLKNQQLVMYCSELENDDEFISQIELISQKTQEIIMRS